MDTSNDPTASTSDTTDVPPDARPRPETVSRFLLIAVHDSASFNVNPFQLHRAISGYGEANHILRRSDGKVEVEMKTSESSQQLLNATELIIRTKNENRKVPITVQIHPTKGFPMGVITVPDLAGVDDGEILEELTEQQVIKARRILRKEDGGAIPTDTIVLSFSCEQLPDKVRVAWRSVRVRPYVPNPIRCYKCQMYGHMASSCKGKERCARCSTVGHNSSQCRAARTKCTCGGDHPVWSKDCPKLQAEVKRAKARVSGSTKRIDTPQPPPPPSDLSEPATPATGSATPTVPPAPCWGAPRGEKGPQEATSEVGPPVPTTMLKTKVQDCLQLSLQQFLALLSNHCCATHSCRATSTTTSDVGVQCDLPDVAHKEVQTDASSDQCTPVFEANITQDTTGTDKVDLGQSGVETSGKRTREESPIQPHALEQTSTRAVSTGDASFRPSVTPTSTKRARVAPGCQPAPTPPEQEQSEDAEQHAMESETTAPPSPRQPQRGEVSTLEIHIGPRPTGKSQENPNTPQPDQSRGRQRISWTDDPPPMGPPPPPPPISSRLGSVSPVTFFSPAQSPSELSKAADAPTRSRSTQRPTRGQDGPTPRGRCLERRYSYSNGNV